MRASVPLESCLGRMISGYLLTFNYNIGLVALCGWIFVWISVYYELQLWSNQSGPRETVFDGKRYSLKELQFFRGELVNFYKYISVATAFRYLSPESSLHIIKVTVHWSFQEYCLANNHISNEFSALTSIRLRTDHIQSHLKYWCNKGRCSLSTWFILQTRQTPTQAPSPVLLYTVK